MSLKVSFVIPVKNGQETIAQTIQSILSQKIDSNLFEIIVIENGSTDKTIERCLNFQNIRVISSSKIGRSVARNLGAKNSNGEFIAFIDADVILDPNWLKSCLEYFEICNADILATRVIPFNGDNTLDHYRKLASDYKTHCTNISLYQRFGVRPIINSASFMIKKSIFDHSGGFSELLIRDEDLEFSMRLHHQGFILAGTSKAISYVIFQEKRRIFSYLFREYEVNRLSLFSNFTLDPRYSHFLLSCLHRREISCCFLGCLVALFGTFGRIIRALDKTLGNVNNEIVSRWKITKNRLIFYLSFEQEKKFHTPKRSIKLVLIDERVYFFFNHFKPIEAPMQCFPIICKLLKNSPLSECEKSFLLSLDFYKTKNENTF